MILMFFIFRCKINSNTTQKYKLPFKLYCIMTNTYRNEHINQLYAVFREYQGRQSWQGRRFLHSAELFEALRVKWRNSTP